MHNEATQLASATLAILAGGEGARMGCPKGRLELYGQPILAHLMHRVAWQGPTLLVTAPGREHPPACEQFSREVTDPVFGEGPLRGMLTALENSETEIVLVATVDMPEIGSHQLGWLLRQIAARPQAQAVTLRADGIEPFPCALRTSMAGLISARLVAGRRSIRALSEEAGVNVLPAPSDWGKQTWRNLNYPADLAAYCGSHLHEGATS
jgi:molybdopterin-guanine dinucleotide biosynthesis protein A